MARWTTGLGPGRSAREPSGRGARRRNRALWGSLAVVFGVLVATTAWLGIRGLAARDHLELARAEAADLKDAVAAGELARAERVLASMQRETGAARDLTHDPVWRAVGAVPLLGDMPRTVSTVSAGVDELAEEALPPLLASGRLLQPATLIRDGSHVDVARLVRAGPGVRRAAVTSKDVDRRLRGVDGRLAGPVRSALSDARRQAREFRRLTDAAARALAVLPPMLGSGGHRSYLVAIQNPAESRGTGGLLGAYAVLDVRDGAVRLRTIGPNTDLKGARRPVVDLGTDFARLYGADPGLWVNANLSPHFPYAARLWLGLWQRQFHERLDGVIAVDPFTLGYLVGATGPVHAGGGRVLTESTTAAYFMHDLYELFPDFDQNSARDTAAAAAGTAIVRNLLSGAVDPAKLVTAGRRAVGEGRLLLYSAHRSEERDIASSRIGGTLSRSPAELSVVINNGGGNKLDYYLERTVRWSLGACTGGQRRSRLLITVRNGAPAAGLPAWVTGEALPKVDGRRPPRGTNRPLVYVFAPPGSRLLGASEAGRALPVRFGAERSRPVFAFPLLLRPGQARTAVLALQGPASRQRPALVEQPLVKPQRSVVTGAECVS
ncbi:MAG: hypothetical protein QOI54_3136 [Actinomycetota bacterium]|jgi:hypothetical protein|nr:hypothetical protein [Actinomycetota bacterium]